MSYGTKKIAVVDDDYEIVELVKAVLRTKGYDIVTAYDGEEGLALILRERPDLAVLDLRMPGMSGLELCKRIRRNPDIADTPILVISSITTGMDKPDEYWAAGLGSDDFLPKPFDPLSLLGKVEYLLRKNQYRSSTGSMIRSEQTPGGNQPAREGMSGAASVGIGRDPADVVRDFVESWNTKDFVREYKALGEEMTGGLSCGEYVQRRAQLYSDENGDATQHRILDTDVQVSHNAATVACLREDMVKGSPRRKDERYTLKKTANGWKIISMKSRPINFMIGGD